ncbi:MAG: divalent-cation tolerance protein CutA [Myxococcota bacterium]
MAETRLRVVLVTTPPEAGPSIARTLVEERLVACVNMTPVRSVYRWEGAVEEEAEQLLIMKTSADRLPALETRLVALHPYDCPEFIALDVSNGAEAYLRWVAAEVRPCAE